MNSDSCSSLNQIMELKTVTIINVSWTLWNDALYFSLSVSVSTTAAADADVLVTDNYYV